MKKTAISLLLAVVMVFSLVLVAAPAAQATTHTHCACGGATVHAKANHTCADTTYTALDQAAADAIAPEDPEAETKYYPLSGTYYLTQNVTINGRVRITGDLSICLNGFELKCNYFRFKGADSYKVDISDCSAAKTGKLTAVEKQMFFNNSSTANPATISVWGGTLENIATDGTQGHIFALGSSTATNTLNIYNGTIKGGNCPGSSSTAAQGGAIRISGGTKCNIYGGTITGGTVNTNTSKSAQGGNIYMTTAGSELNIYGGTITGGTAAVGTMEGALTVAQGGNIYTGGGTLNLYGGTITGGVAATESNMRIGGTINIVSVDGTVTFNATAEDKVVTENKAANIKVTNNELEYTITKTAGGNADTGDSANLVVMGLGLVLGVAGMACLLPKKQTV